MVFQGTFEKRCLTTGAPTELSFLTTSLSMLFILTNIPGNLLIILAVIIDPNKNLRSPFNWLMANLAMADLIVGIATDPMSAYFHMKEGLNLNISKEDVRAIHITYFISCTASVLSLSTLAVERYLAIRKPHTYRNEFTTKRILLTVAWIWFISLSLPQVYFKVGYITYAFIFANTSIVLAIIITCFTYSLMLYKIKERSQNLNQPPVVASFTNISMEASTTITLSTLPPSPASSNSVIVNSARLMERKVTKMFIVVLIALLCCYGPSTIMIYIMSFCESCSCVLLHWFRDLQFVFVIMNSSVNFYCYALRSSRFRSAFAKILKINRSRQRADFSNVQTERSGSRSAQLE